MSGLRSTIDYNQILNESHMLHPPVLSHEMFLGYDGDDGTEHGRIETIPDLRQVDEAEGDNEVEQGQGAVQVRQVLQWKLKRYFNMRYLHISPAK